MYVYKNNGFSSLPIFEWKMNNLEEDARTMICKFSSLPTLNHIAMVPGTQGPAGIQDVMYANSLDGQRPISPDVMYAEVY